MTDRRDREEGANDDAEAPATASGHEHDGQSCSHHADQAGGTGRDGRTPSTGTWFCPCCPGVEADEPGQCPHCGMTLQRADGGAKKMQYTCPMHPEIVRDEPGDCPICGMALEPMTVTADEGPSAELVSMTRRFWISAALSLPLLVITMGEFVGMDVGGAIGHTLSAWVQFLLATPVLLWGGWPFFARGWQSVVNRRLNPSVANFRRSTSNL